MIRQLAIPAAFALMLGACASYDSGYNRGYSSGTGYYVPGNEGYGDYYYDNPQVIVDDRYRPYWDGYGGYSPYNGFGFQFGFGPGWYGGYPYGYSEPWYGYRHHHHHRRDHDGDNDGDDRPRIGSAAPITTPGPGHAQQRAGTNPESNPWQRQWSGAAPSVGMNRPPSPPPDMQRPRPIEEGRFRASPPAREELPPRRRRDADGDGRDGR